MREVKFSLGNNHLGKTSVLNISLTPIKSCKKGVPCATSHCFAIKLYKLRTPCRNAWDNNLDFYRTNHVEYFKQINREIELRQPKLFRFHVSGDIPTYHYLEKMIETSKLFPHVLFNCYTKQYGFVQKFVRRNKIPSNMDLRISIWKDYPYPKDLDFLPKAYIVGDSRVPTGTFYCDKSVECIECKRCWKGHDVVFKKLYQGWRKDKINLELEKGRLGI